MQRFLTFYDLTPKENYDINIPTKKIIYLAGIERQKFLQMIMLKLRKDLGNVTGKK